MLHDIVEFDRVTLRACVVTVVLQDRDTFRDPSDMLRAHGGLGVQGERRHHPIISSNVGGDLSFGMTVM